MMTAPRVSGWTWWVCIALLFATMLNYMDRQTLSLTATALKAEIHLDDGRYGALEQWFSWAFAAGSILFGFMADRFGPKYLYPAVLVGWSLAGMAAPLATWPSVVDALADAEGSPGSGEFRWLLITRTLLGLFEAGHWPCALLTIRAILSAENRPFGNSILQSGASMGAIATPLVVQLLRHFGFGWQTSFFAIGLLGFLWIPVWFAMIRGIELRSPHNCTTHIPTAGEERIVVSRLIVQIVCLATFITGISLSWQFLRAWLAKFLKESRGYDDATANYFTIVYFIAADLGCLLAGYLVTFWTHKGVDVRSARLRSAALCAGLCALVAVVGHLDAGALLLGVLLLFAAGILGLHPHYYSMVQDLPAKSMGVISGFLAASSWFAVGAMQRQIGNHIKATGSYTEGFWLAAAAPVVALVAMACVPRKATAGASVAGTRGEQSPSEPGQ
jgi:MFS transporter, ACS family, hexuronate transporter